jgi:mitochondrial fission protein ELM1
MDGAARKFARFHADLEARGIARRFSGGLETWTYAPLHETDSAARELLRRYGARAS